MSKQSKKAVIKNNYIDYNEVLDKLIDVCIEVEAAVPSIGTEVSTLFIVEREETLNVLEQLFDMSMVYQSMDTKEAQGLLAGMLAIIVQQRIDMLDAEEMEQQEEEDSSHEKT